MGNPSFELRELFHLSFLRHLSQRLRGRAYALKGGACLRFFHRSPRFSQDIDLDIVPQVRVKTLEEAVDSILESRSFLAPLIPHGVLRLGITKPKQTQTTQRWKVSLSLGPEEKLPTKIEFSRRHEKIPSCHGIPDAGLLNAYKMIPFAVLFYDAAPMAAQKIVALASPTRHAARDLFDLHHLLYTIQVKPEDLTPLIEPDQIADAAEKIGSFTFRDFKEQVLPYLTETLITLYQDPKVFEGLKGKVEEALIQISP